MREQQELALFEFLHELFEQRERFRFAFDLNQRVGEVVVDAVARGVGAIDRFKSVLKDDPDYTGRDSVYYYLADSLVQIKREPEALPYFERLVQEFEQSQFLLLTQKKIAELKAQTVKP